MPNAIKAIDVEFQLLRDERPRIRPYKGQISLSASNTWFKTFPSVAAEVGESITLRVGACQHVMGNWYAMLITFDIDGIVFSDYYALWVCVSDPLSAVPTGILHFPIKSDNPTFGGHHILLIRGIATIE